MHFRTNGAAGTKKPYVVRIFSNYRIDSQQALSLLNKSGNLSSEIPVEFIFNKSGRADYVVILNVVKSLKWVMVPKGNILKVLQEPKLNSGLTHRFTYRHEKYLDVIFTHSPDESDSRQKLSIGFPTPFVETMVGPDEFLRQKKQIVSIIASTISEIPGHVIRNKFISSLIEADQNLEEHLFGRGRVKALVNKQDALIPYMYSVAIENTHQDSYITEKFFDCIMSGTVPIYSGAHDVEKYFPPDCYLKLPIDNVEKCLELIHSLDSDDYIKRVPALIEAQRIVFRKIRFEFLFVGACEK